MTTIIDEIKSINKIKKDSIEKEKIFRENEEKNIKKKQQTEFNIWKANFPKLLQTIADNLVIALRRDGDVAYIRKKLLENQNLPIEMYNTGIYCDVQTYHVKHVVTRPVGFGSTFSDEIREQYIRSGDEYNYFKELHPWLDYYINSPEKVKYLYDYTKNHNIKGIIEDNSHPLFKMGYVLCTSKKYKSWGTGNFCYTTELVFLLYGDKNYDTVDDIKYTPLRKNISCTIL